jgi:hypothetical protein
MVQSVQPGREWLLQSYEQVPGPELAAVSMAGKLQIKPGACRRGRGARLVRQQNSYARLCRRTCKGNVGITTLGRIKLM